MVSISVPRYVPHYDLLDPVTGRSLRNPRTSPSVTSGATSRIFSYYDQQEDQDDSYVRPQREVKGSGGANFALPIGNLRDHFYSVRAYFASLLYLL